MEDEIITRGQLGALGPERRAALERMYAEAGLPAELAHDLDLLWRLPPETPPSEAVGINHSSLTADEIAALNPVFAPLWRSRHGSITWVALLDVLLTARPGPVRARRHPEAKRANEKMRSLLRRLPKDFWGAAATGIEALQTLDPQRKDRLLAICRGQTWRAQAVRKRLRQAVQ
jgi:hypothetical protein